MKKETMINVRWLQRHQACEDAIAEFKKRFPSGVSVRELVSCLVGSRNHHDYLAWIAATVLKEHKGEFCSSRYGDCWCKLIDKQFTTVNGNIVRKSRRMKLVNELFEKYGKRGYK